MANFPKMQLTSKGLELLTNVQAGADTLTFTKTALGDGVISVPISTLTALVSSKAELPISEGKNVGKNTYQIGAFFNNTEITTGFWWREIGVFAKGNNGTEILYCYSNAGDAGDYIPVGTDERIEKYIYQSLSIGNASNVNAEINGNDSFVPNADKGKPNGVAPLDADGKIPSEYINMDLSDIETLLSDVDNALIEHKDDKNNPHGVNAATVGLDKVPNVATNDQTPTYTEESTLTGMISGEKLGVAFGKIKKAITDLISHLADTTKHITATERTSWNSKVTKSGDTMTGNLGIIKNELPSVTLKSDKANSTVYRNVSNTIEDGLWLKDTKDTSNPNSFLAFKLSHAKDEISLIKATNGTSTTYNLYGEHNPPPEFKLLKSVVVNVSSVEYANSGVSNSPTQSIGAIDADTYNEFLFEFDGTFTGKCSASGAETSTVQLVLGGNASNKLAQIVLPSGKYGASVTTSFKASRIFTTEKVVIHKFTNADAGTRTSNSYITSFSAYGNAVFGMDNNNMLIGITNSQAYSWAAIFTGTINIYGRGAK